MNPILRNVIAVIAGIVFGGLVNMGLIMLSPSVIPPPEGVNVADMESLKAAMNLFEPRHFIFPFLAHALGALSGAWLAASLAASHKMKFAIGIGAFTMIGGIVNAFMLPAPIWFIALDLLAAYIPMAWIGGMLGGGRRAVA
ncbi:MAG: hypothetical protein IH600_01285 [Bacteroidetes bacterium]|nr:hypothetical protein [Bacteroidota bacterium]